MDKQSLATEYSGKQLQLDELKRKMQSDDTLPLKKGATNLVFGEGNPEAEILLIGEGPGYWEDMKSRPFVGNAGAFLNQLLASVKIAREDVFITNVVHHRPPENRDPEEFELNAYKPYLDKIIEIINPKVIVTLGRFSMGKFIPEVKISGVHGKERVVEFNGRKIVVFPMYHPAAALRSTAVKLQSINDFKKLPDIIAKVKETEDSGNDRNGDNTKQMSLI